MSGNTLGKKSTSEVPGGGGTDISSVKRYLENEKRRPQLVIYLTDGYIPPPEFIARSKRLFIITKNGEEGVLKPHGQTVKLT